MKKLFYSFVILSGLLLVLFIIGPLSTAQNERIANPESEDQDGLQEIYRTQTGPLTNGATHTGVIQVAGVDTWTIDATANDNITASVGEVSGSGFTPRLALIGPGGVDLGDDNGPNAAEFSKRVTVTGTYIVEVSNEFPNSQIGPANYILTVTRTPGPYVISPDDEGGPLTNGANHTGLISVGDQDTWTIDAVANESITASVGKVSGSGFSPRLRLLRPDGATSGDDNGPNAAEVSIRVTVAGTYTVVISNELPNSQVGLANYTLTVARTPGPFIMSPGDEGGPMASGADHTGTIDVGDIDPWVFHATANSGISLSISEVVVGGPDPVFSPQLRLMGPDGVMLDDVNGATSAQIIRLAPLTGVYTVLVTNNVPNSQVGPGSYTLAFTGPPQPTLSINNVTQNEGNSGTTSFNFNVTLSGAVTQVVNVNYETVNGNAIAPGDYNAVGSTQLTFNPGDLSKAVTVLVNGDATVEANEMFFVNLDGALAVQISNSQATGTITNDDSTIQFSPATYSVNENGGNATITATRTGSSTGAVSAQYAASDGTATVGQDYSTTIGTLNWADGDLAPKSFSVPITDDSVFEGNETVNLTLSNPTGGGTIGIPNAAVLTIVDNETQPTLSMANTTAGAEPVGASIFTVTLSGRTTSAVTVHYATANGSATEGSDYIARSGDLTFTANTTALSQTISVSTLDDVVFEGPENFTVTLSVPTNATISGSNPAIGTIADNETQPTLSIVNTTGGAEPGLANVFTVSLSGQTTSAVTVHYASANGSATTGGGDYTATSGDLTFVANTSTLTQTITVSTLDDLIFEGLETFTVTLSVPANATISGTNPAIGTIADNETQPTLSINNVTQDEGNNGTTAFTFTVTLSGETTQTVTVNYATADGTATSASGDYNALPAIPLTFNPGDLAKPVTVLVNGDTAAEPSETFLVNLSGASNAAIANPQATGTISDDDTVTFVLVSGKVMTSGGLGLRNAVVSLTDSQGARRTATTSSFGIYSFDNVQTRETYVITVSSKRYRFAPRVLLISGEMTGVDFVGLE